MNINAIEELVRVLGQIDHKIKEIEISPNRAFVLIEYDTLSLFHWFNLCFKQFWDEFDRHSASQLLLYLNISDRYSELSKNYINLIREQISYLGRVIDFEHKCVKELPPVIFSEDNSTDVIGYYNELCKHSIDEDNKPLYRIDVDRDMHSEVINGKDVPIDFYLFRSNKINGIHYEGLYSMHKSLSYILDLMYTVSSYPYDLTNGTEISLEDTINALEKGLRQYAIEVGKDVERDLKIMAQGLKPSRNATIDSNVWGKVMDEEDRIYNSAISGKWGEDDERLLEHISATKEQLTENFALLQKIKTSSFDEELFDIRLSVKNHQLLSSINTENLDLFYELVLRRNIIHCEMFPEELRAKYDEWLKGNVESTEECGENSPVFCLSNELSTEEAMKYWKGLKQKQFVDDNYQLLESTTRQQAAYIAELFSEKLNIKTKWKTFEDVWGIKNLAQEKNQRLEIGKNPSRSNEIDDIFEE